MDLPALGAAGMGSVTELVTGLDLVAPGGDTSRDDNGDNYADEWVEDER